MTCLTRLRWPDGRWIAVAAGVLIGTWGLIGPVFAESPQAEEPRPANRLLIQAQHLHRGNGQTLSPGMVLVEDGKIAAVGKAIDLPDGAREVQVHSLMPGMVNAASSAGIVGGGGESSREVTADFETFGLVDWSSREFKEATDQGETTLHVMPSTDNVISGWTCILKPAAGSSEDVIKARQGVAVSLCSDPTGRNRSRTRPDSIYVRQPTNRMGVVWILRNQLHQTVLKGPEDRESPQTAPLSKLLAGDVPAYGVSRTAFDIQTLLRIGEEFEFSPIVVGGHESYKVIELLKSTGTSVIYTALEPGILSRERTELFWATPSRLQEAGVPFCIAGDGLLEKLRLAVRFGLEPEQAIASVTSRPAEMLGLQERVGSIAAGADADLLGFAGPPFERTSAVEWVMVHGRFATGAP